MPPRRLGHVPSRRSVHLAQHHSRCGWVVTAANLRPPRRCCCRWPRGVCQSASGSRQPLTYSLPLLSKPNNNSPDRGWNESRDLCFESWEWDFPGIDTPSHMIITNNSVSLCNIPYYLERILWIGQSWKGEWHSDMWEKGAWGKIGSGALRYVYCYFAVTYSSVVHLAVSVLDKILCGVWCSCRGRVFQASLSITTCGRRPTVLFNRCVAITEQDWSVVGGWWRWWSFNLTLTVTDECSIDYFSGVIRSELLLSGR